MPLFKDPDELFEREVYFNIPYEHLINPDNNLLEDDELTILIEVFHPAIGSKFLILATKLRDNSSATIFPMCGAMKKKRPSGT